MEDGVYTVRPTILRRWRTADEIAAASIAVAEDEGEPGEARRALLVFMNERQAEDFHAETGLEADVATVDLYALRNVIEMFGFEHVALRGPEPNVTSVLSAADFLRMLEEAE